MFELPVAIYGEVLRHLSQAFSKWIVVAVGNQSYVDVSSLLRWMQPLPKRFKASYFVVFNSSTV